jgi:hypothetical protein
LEPRTGIEPIRLRWKRSTLAVTSTGLVLREYSKKPHLEQMGLLGRLLGEPDYQKTNDPAKNAKPRSRRLNPSLVPTPKAARRNMRMARIIRSKETPVVRRTIGVVSNTSFAD